MSQLRLKTVTRVQGANKGLIDGRVTLKGFAFDFVEVPTIIDGFRRMVRGLEFDVCEMAFSTYLCAREHNVPFTALPIFLVRGFHHGAIVHNVHAGIHTPKDLEGREVGVSRGYTVTTGVWARGILHEEYGVDLSKVRWMRSGDEHVAEYVPPPNVGRLPEGKSLANMVAGGELAAAINVTVDHPDVRPLIPDPDRAAFQALVQRGLYPINHLVVVRDDLIRAHPGLAVGIFEVFAEAKHLYVERLRAGAVDDPTQVDRFHLRAMEVLGDPLPYGIEPNRAMIETLIRFASSQRILTRPVVLEETFAEDTLDLVD
ncbi:MAG TPA: ABC transporter substrate-binding protein [Acidimicrobiia bacterium]|nr:ABC transporter substrate-binding protein [Acidimicrobiia bacterium]